MNTLPPVRMHRYTNKHTHIIIIIGKRYHSLPVSDSLGVEQVAIHTIAEDTAWE